MKTNRKIANFVDKMLENDEYSPEEAAFMIGYFSEDE